MLLEIEDRDLKFVVDAVTREVMKQLRYNPFEPRFLTPKQVAKLVGCTANNVRKKCREGALPFEKNGAKAIVISKKEVDRRLKSLEEGQSFWDA